MICWFRLVCKLNAFTMYLRNFKIWNTDDFKLITCICNRWTDQSETSFKLKLLSKFQSNPNHLPYLLEGFLNTLVFMGRWRARTCTWDHTWHPRMESFQCIRDISTGHVGLLGQHWFTWSGLGYGYPRYYLWNCLKNYMYRNT